MKLKLLESSSRHNYDQDFTIIQLETQQQQHKNKDEQVVSFGIPVERQLMEWSFALPTCSTGELYMITSCYSTRDITLYAYKFDFRTGILGKIKPPPLSRYPGHAVHLDGRIYFMEHPGHSTNPVFECYDPTLETWKPLKPFPDPPSTCRIKATAVWDDDTILFNIASLGETSGTDFPFSLGVVSRHIWAYAVCRQEWYVVDVEDVQCFHIVGKAVVLNNTIYALADLEDGVVLALSIGKEVQNDGNLVFECSLRSRILVPDFEPLLFMEKAWARRSYLVHLGESDFCIVDTCKPKNFLGHQPIQVSHIRLEGEKMIMVDGYIHYVKIQRVEHFYALHCFPLPKDMTTALKGKKLAFDLDPFADEEGRTVYLRNLPRHAADKHFNMLRKFGPVKKITTWKNHKGNLFANVKFERAISKQLAIKASTIKIGHLTAEILEKPPRTLGQAADPFGKNKLKKHGGKVS